MLFSLEHLYALDEINKNFFEGHVDSTDSFKEKWLDLTEKIDRDLENPVFIFQFFENIASHFEELFKLVDNLTVSGISITAIESYLEFSFKHYLLNIAEVSHFFSLPLEEQHKEFFKIYKRQKETHKKIKLSSERFVDKVHEGFIEYLEKKDVAESQDVSISQIRHSFFAPDGAFITSSGNILLKFFKDEKEDCLPSPELAWQSRLKLCDCYLIQTPVVTFQTTTIN